MLTAADSEVDAKGGVLDFVNITVKVSDQVDGVPFRQKTLRPKLTQAEGFILGVGAKMFK